MSINLPPMQEAFWPWVEALLMFKGKMPLAAFQDEYGLPLLEFEEVQEVVGVVKNLGAEVTLIWSGSDCLIKKNNHDNQRVVIDMDITEWLALQSHFPTLSQLRGSFPHEKVTEVMKRVEKLYPKYDFFHLMDDWKRKRDVKKQMCLKGKELTQKLETYIEEKSVVAITYQASGNLINLFPHRLVYLEGSLVLIGEEISDKMLISIPIDEIAKLKINNDNSYQVNFSGFEVDEFIFAIRSLCENEERLILKVKEKEGSLDLSPAHHFLGNPYITSNLEGEMIWAASVEVSTPLFEWLHRIEGTIEILDPFHVKTAFEQYKEQCQVKNKSLKKAS